MKTNTKFNFEVSISKDYYRQKPSGIDYARMKWTKRNVSVKAFANLVMQGYSYCHIYFNNLRRKDKFLHTNIVSIDVDDTDVCLAEFIDGIQLQPTFAYETFSNGIDGKYSYRLVYVTEEKMNRMCFTQVYEKICRMTGLENTKDHCGKVLTQLMNGTRPDAYQYRSNIVYSTIHDLPVPATEEPSDIWDCNQKIPLKPVEIPFDFNNDYYNINISHKNQTQYNTKEPFCTPKRSDLDGMLVSLKELGRKDFLDRCSPFYKLIRWSKLTYNENGYTVIPDNHLSLFVRYRHIGKECVINRFKDGEKRRNRLFIDGCIIRKISPGIKIHELFYNLVHRVFFYYDNSDGILSDSLIARKAFEVMEYDVESMEFQSMNTGKITTSPGYCREHGLSRTALSRKALMIENYAGISEWYNSALSAI